MKKSLYLLTLAFIAVLTSCQTLEVISIDYLVPSDVSFPAELRRVGVVNNVNVNAPDNRIVADNDTVVKDFYELARKVEFYNGNPKLTTESLAESIAEANYFDEVIISDSILRANDIAIRETILSEYEVNQLADELDVDLILALENILIKATRTVSYGAEGGYIGAVDAKVYPNVKIYLPNRKTPLLSINASDSIFWEDLFSTQLRAMNGVIDKDELITEASTFAGTVPVKHIIPYWKTVQRFYYSTNSRDMRDASVLAREGSWDQALTIWQRVYESKKIKDRMRAALNIALYYEVNDNLEEAESWLIKAQTLAQEMENVQPGGDSLRISADNAPNFYLTTFYLNEIQKRKELQAKLNMQMQRFNNENQ